jgi:2'-5' RNA ligase
VALDVDEPLRGEVARVQAALRPSIPGARWVDPALCHITIRFLGQVAAERVPAIAEACRSAAGSVTSFELVFEGVGAFPRTLWVDLKPEPALTALHAAVERELAREGFRPESRPFAPHLTLARFKEPVKLASAIRPFAAEHLGTVRVKSLRLMRSDIRPRGPVYTVLKELLLGGV